MRRINLLPPELAARRRTRQLAGGLVAAGLGVLGLLVILFLAKQAMLAGQRGKLEDQERVNAGLQRQVTQLAQFQQQQDELRTKEQLLVGLTRSEVRWSVILDNISAVIPADAWLTNFTGQLTAAGTPGAAGAVGQLQLGGCTLTPPGGTFLNVAAYLVQIAKPLEFADDPFLTLASIGTADCDVTFTSQVPLTEAARRVNQRGGARTL